MKIELTETEIDLIRDALHAFEPQNTGWEQIDLNELSDDLLEQTARRDDGWGEDERFNDADDLVGRTFEVVVRHDFVDSDSQDRHSAETQMFNAGVHAREALKEWRQAARSFMDSDVKTGSMAANRRRMRSPDKS
tara:strand:+ start:3141 stop:3545 length:405 start_codon:yes stop_codon:yes gene_type:complete